MAIKTGKMIFDEAMTLLGYSEETAEIPGGEELVPKALIAVNRIYADLYYIFDDKGFEPLKRLTDEIKGIPEKYLNDAFVYGVAMMLATFTGDGNMQSCYSAIYNQKRRTARPKTIKDVLPRAY